MNNPLSPQLYAILSTLVEERTGLHYGREDMRVFADKVSGRLAEAGFDNALDYYYLLRYDDPAHAELDALIDALVVGETYFFRELDALRAAVEHVVRPAVERRGRARVWSAGCATGEEPVTLAMLIQHAGLLDKCEIVATDISLRSLARARNGVYGSRSLRMITPHAEPIVKELAARWLVRDPATNGAVARVARPIVDAIDYRRVNLVDEREVAALGRFDLVLCRNVLIYFGDETVQRVSSLLGGALAEGGRLVIGASESLLRFGTLLHCEERAGCFFYARDE